MKEEYKFHCCCSRLNEFFDWYEIDWFLANVENYNLNPHKAIKWLDMEVRADYVSGIDMTPDIYFRTIKYFKNQDIKF